MNSKNNKNKTSNPSKHMSSNENKYTEHNYLSNKTVDAIVGNDDFGFAMKSRKQKIKAHFNSQEEDGCSVEVEPKQKKKYNQTKGDKVVTSGSTMDIISGDSDMEVTKQDNTPESLKKQKKLKKKKSIKLITKNVQPNTGTLDYLRKWKNDRSHWKFEKVKQIRLVSSMFDSEKLPEDYFSIFLEYMEGASNSMKELMLKSANEVVNEMEKWESMSDTKKETTPKVDEHKYKRARTLLQMLQ